LRVKGSVFRSNHASNYLALKGNLPKDQEALVGYLEDVIARPEEAHFAPEWIRGL
jgi:hypothetical protein